MVRNNFIITLIKTALLLVCLSEIASRVFAEMLEHEAEPDVCYKTSNLH